ncbi:hypothetical protein BDFG_06569 [Blastomyces dermatitidis ATCC 26199]|nr:hypothetical protein BDFG_06569 [Blastomyces dermatitidis ATCC 26199]
MRLCRLNSEAFQAELRYAAEEKLQIKLLKVTVLRIKLSSESSLNNHMRSYVTVLIEERSSVAIMMRRAGNELNADELTGRRNNISLQGIATTAAAVRDVEEEEDVIIRVMLLQLIDTAVFIFN